MPTNNDVHINNISSYNDKIPASHLPLCRKKKGKLYLFKNRNYKNKMPNRPCTQEATKTVRHHGSSEQFRSKCTTLTKCPKYTITSSNYVQSANLVIYKS